MVGAGAEAPISKHLCACCVKLHPKKKCVCGVRYCDRGVLLYVSFSLKYK